MVSRRSDCKKLSKHVEGWKIGWISTIFFISLSVRNWFFANNNFEHDVSFKRFVWVREDQFMNLYTIKHHDFVIFRRVIQWSRTIWIKRWASYIYFDKAVRAFNVLWMALGTSAKRDDQSEYILRINTASKQNITQFYFFFTLLFSLLLWTCL